jgi:ribonucleoside-triphosphate reductase
MVVEKIKKRSGESVPFDSEKIRVAAEKALLAADGLKPEEAHLVSQRVCDKVVTRLEMMFHDGISQPTVEQTQNLVEDALMSLGKRYHLAAKGFILYRAQHSKIREITKGFDGKLVQRYLDKQDWMVNGNANVAYSLQGLNNYVSEEISKNWWLNMIYPLEIKEAHVNGDFHLHDLGIIGAYCVGWDLEDFLMRGITGVPGKTSAKPPCHLEAALGQIVNLLYTLQGESAGAQAISHFDTFLAPFIKYDKLEYSAVKQRMSGFLHNMNQTTRVGGQTPFTNITLDLKVPKGMMDKPVIRGGKMMNETYGQFQTEMDMINRAFAECMIEGDADERIFTFPIPTYNIIKGLNWDDPGLEPIWKMTAKYGTPYFSNFVNSDMDPEDARSMCCRLRLDQRELRKRGGGLFGANPLTGSMGVVTINMSRLGYVSSNEEEFFKKLSHLMDLAKESLEIKRKTLEGRMALYPYSRFYLRNVKQRFNEYWKNHFSTIGLLGMNEAVMNLTPGENMATEKGRRFAVKVLDFMRERLIMYQEETGNNYNLEATPGEGATYRFAKKDKEDFPNIIVANENAVRRGAKPFYTNSTQLPVGYTDDIFEALDLQDELQTKYTGGTVVHLFVGEEINPDDVKRIVKSTTGNYRLPYFTITPTFSICPTHKYMSGEHEYCPRCEEVGEKIPCEVYSRVVGYIRPVNQWNEGKQAEWHERKLFKIDADETMIVVEKEAQHPNS